MGAGGGDGVAVRALGAGDRGAWGPLWAGFVAEVGGLGPEGLPEEVTAGTWARVTAPEGYRGMKMRGLAAERGGELAGFAHFHFQHVTFALEPRIYLEDLFVAQEHRRQGVARALIEAVYAVADAEGCSEVYWKTGAKNARARALYDRVAGCNGETVYVRSLRPKK